MTMFDIAEQAYKNGYTRGYQDGLQAAEPKKAHWIVHSSGRGLVTTNWAECSACNTAGSPTWKRRPVCEAKMEVT